MMYYNPFQRFELRIPEEYRERVEEFSRTRATGGQRPSPDDSPFERQVDLWFAAVCLGARKGKRVTPAKWHKFNDGTVLLQDAWRIELLELLAIGLTDRPEVIGDPAEVVEIANELAAAALPELFFMMEQDAGDHIWNLTDGMLNLLDEGATASSPRRAEA